MSQKAMRRRIALQSTSCEFRGNASLVSRKLLECVRVLASLLTALLFVRRVMILWLLRSFETLVGPKTGKN